MIPLRLILLVSCFSTTLAQTPEPTSDNEDVLHHLHGLPQAMEELLTKLANDHPTILRPKIADHFLKNIAMLLDSLHKSTSNEMMYIGMAIENPLYGTRRPIDFCSGRDLNMIKLPEYTDTAYIQYEEGNTWSRYRIKVYDHKYLDKDETLQNSAYIAAAGDEIAKMAHASGLLGDGDELKGGGPPLEFYDFMHLVSHNPANFEKPLEVHYILGRRVYLFRIAPCLRSFADGWQLKGTSLDDDAVTLYYEISRNYEPHYKRWDGEWRNYRNITESFPSSAAASLEVTYFAVAIAIVTSAFPYSKLC